MTIRWDRWWRPAFAAGLLLRPLLIVPMVPSGPLAGSDLLPLGLGALITGSAVLAVGALVGLRPLHALGIISCLVGVPLAVAGAAVGLPMPWPLLVAIANGVLAVTGILAWEAPRDAGDRALRRPAGPSAGPDERFEE